MSFIGMNPALQSTQFCTNFKIRFKNVDQHCIGPVQSKKKTQAFCLESQR